MATDIIITRNRTFTFQAHLEQYNTTTSAWEDWDVSTATEIYLTVANEHEGAVVLQITYTGGGLTFATDGSDGLVNIAIDNSDTADKAQGVYLNGFGLC